MPELRTLGIEGQVPPPSVGVFQLPAEVASGSMLGNMAIQLAHSASHRTALDSLRGLNGIRHGAHPGVPQVAPRLEALKRIVFTPEGKAERVKRSLDALTLSDSAVIRLSPEDWKLVAEDPDLEDGL